MEKERHFVLLSDTLLYGIPKVEGKSSTQCKVRGWFGLGKGGESMEPIEDDPSQGLAHAFRVTGKKKSFLLWARSGAEKEEWVTALRKAKEFREKVARVEREKRKDSEASPGASRSRRAIAAQSDSSENQVLSPVWDNDRTSSSCLACEAPFTLTRRRHHCRKCGKLVCDRCSSQRCSLPASVAGKKERVCDACYKDLIAHF